MKNLTSHKIRSMFMMGGVAAMMGVTMMFPQAARADKEKNYKIGATALGILGAVLAVKGKTLPAVIAGAGAYYAYEKGKDAKEEKRYEDRYNDYRWNDRRDDRNDHRYNDYYGNRYDHNNDRYGRNDWNDRYDNRYDARNDNRYDWRYDRNDSRDNRHGHYSHSR